MNGHQKLLALEGLVSATNDDLLQHFYFTDGYLLKIWHLQKPINVEVVSIGKELLVKVYKARELLKSDYFSKPKDIWEAIKAYLLEEEKTWQE